MTISQAVLRVHLTTLFLHGMDGHADSVGPRATLPSILNIAAGERKST